MTPEEKITNILKKKGRLTPTKTFSWEEHSWEVAEYCPQYFDPEKYNWKVHSWAVLYYCPQHFNPQMYNWAGHSYNIGRYSPDKIEPRLYNWKRESSALLFYHPNHKYLKHCIWNKKTIDDLKEYSKYEAGIWKKYENQINDLLDPTKRETLLNKISKEITLEKI